MAAARHSPPPRPCRAAAAACAVLFAVGCGRTLDTEYATVRGPSINGAATFVQLLRDAGHSVTATSLVPAGGGAAEPGTLVVFNDRCGQLPAETRDRLERFLAGGGRTLVVVVRDDDCAIGYWRAIAARPDLTADRRQEVERSLAEARAALAERIAEAVPPDVAELGYTLETVERAEAADLAGVRVKPARGPAAETVEARWELHRRLVPGPAGRVLWRCGDDPLLVAEQRGDDRILVVAAATPLLNGGLVDPGNRRLAADLVARIPAGDRVHVAGSGDVAGDGDGEGGAGAEPSIRRLLAVQPHPWIAAQALVAMAIFCWWRSPIVGRPRRENPAAAQDFGHHVAALGGLLARARGDAFAVERIEEWRRISAAAATRARGSRGREPRGGRHGHG